MASLKHPILPIALVLAACGLPDEPDRPDIETAYLLDRIDGVAPPAEVCEGGEVLQLLRFESIALAEDGSYGRLQQTQVGSNTPQQAEERGTFERLPGEILLINAATDTVVLTLLDSAGEFVRRLHACGDTLRYASVPVED